MSEMITILKKATRHAEPVTYSASFEPVRRIKSATIGWATVSTDGGDLTFPVIVDHAADRVLTVNDWQAPRGSFATDLADPKQVAEQIATGAGRFVSPVGLDTLAERPFARAAAMGTLLSMD